MKISVVLAAYKGEKYIAEQINSILPQLGDDDEVIVSDDFPEGKTRDEVLAIRDGRIRYVEGPGKGVTANFGYALAQADGDIIFLCDQDDVWLPEKVGKVTDLLEKGYDLVLHDASVTDASLNVTLPSYFAVHGSYTSFARTLLRNTFVGCCMAFTRRVRDSVTPIPDGVPMHDWWIALASMKKGFRITTLNEPLILWRRHGDNVTGSRTSLKQKISWRLKIMDCLRKI